jgi:hypothetical protein
MDLVADEEREVVVTLEEVERKTLLLELWRRSSHITML